MSAVIGIAIIFAVVALAIWAATHSGKPDGGNGDNRESAVRLGSGYHGP